MYRKSEAIYEFPFYMANNALFNYFQVFWNSEATYDIQSQWPTRHDSSTSRWTGECCICLKCHYDRSSTAYSSIPLSNTDCLHDFENLCQNLRRILCIRGKYRSLRWCRNTKFGDTSVKSFTNSDHKIQPWYFHVYNWCSVTPVICNSVKYDILGFVWSQLSQAVIHYWIYHVSLVHLPTCHSDKSATNTLSRSL